MPRVKVGLALPDGSTLDVEIARLRDLDVASLQVRLHNVLRREPSPHLPRHLLFRVLAYRLQAEHLGDLDVESRRLLDGAGPPEDAGKRAVDSNRPTAELKPGTMLARRLAYLAAAFEPPPAFHAITYDVPPPLEEEVVYFRRPVLASVDEPLLNPFFLWRSGSDG
jgi:hypothetical protein